MATKEAEKARERAADAYVKLTELLDKEGHGPECALRCIEDPCHEGWKRGFDHACDVCGEDEG